MLAATSVGAAAGNLPPDLAGLLQSGVVRIGYQANAFPFAYRPMPADAEAAAGYVGYSVDLCALVVAELNARLADAGGVSASLRVVPVEVNSRTRIAMLLAGRIDLECGSTTASKDRTRLVGQADPRLGVAFSRLIFFSDVAVAVPASSTLRTLDDLARSDQTVLVVAGTTTPQRIEAFRARKPNAAFRVDFADDFGEAFDRLSEPGQVDAIALDRVLLRSRLPRGGFRLLDGELAPEGEAYGLMYRRSDAAIGKAIDAALTTAASDGTFAKIYRRWLLSPVPRPRSSRLSAEPTIGVEMPEALRREWSLASPRN